MTYYVTTADRAGPLDAREFSDFETALAFYASLNTYCSSDVVVSMHTSNAECDGGQWCDGLTEEEWSSL